MLLYTVILVVKPYFVHGCELNIHPRKWEMLKYEEFQLPEHMLSGMYLRTKKYIFDRVMEKKKIHVRKDYTRLCWTGKLWLSIKQDLAGSPWKKCTKYSRQNHDDRSAPLWLRMPQTNRRKKKKKASQEYQIFTRWSFQRNPITKARKLLLLCNGLIRLLWFSPFFSFLLLPEAKDYFQRIKILLRKTSKVTITSTETTVQVKESKDFDCWTDKGIKCRLHEALLSKWDLKLISMVK